MDMKLTPFIYGKKHPYGHPVVGYEKVLRKLTPDKIKKYYDYFYQPNNAVLVVAGDVDPESALGKIKKHFAKIPRRSSDIKKINNYIGNKPAPKPAFYEFNKKVNIKRLSLTFLTVPITHPDYPAFLILDRILSSGESSRIYKAIVEKRLASDSGTWTYNRKLAGEFGFWAELPIGQSRQPLIDAFFATVKNIAENPPARAEVQKAINQVLSDTVFSKQTTFSVAETLGINEVLYNNPEYDKLILQKIARLKPADIAKVAHKYLLKSQPIVAVLKPAEKIKYKTVKTGGFQIEKFALANGLQVELVEEHSLPMIAFDLDFRLASLYEPADKVGLFAMLGEMLTQGTKKYTAEQIAEKLDFMGVTFEASGNGVRCQTLKKFFEQIMQLTAEIAKNSTFPKDKFELKRKRLIEDLQSSLDDTDTVALREFNKLIYPATHPYAFAETVEGYKRLKREDVIAFYKKIFIPNIARLHVVGDISISELYNIVNRYFSDWQKGEMPRLQLPKVALQKNDRKKYVSMPDKVQVSVYLGHLGIKRSNPDYYTLLVLDNILGTGAGFTDRLSADLRDTQGLAYSLGMWSADTSRYDYGKVYAYLSTSPKNIVKAIAGIIKHIKRIQTEPVKDSEIQGAKAYLTGFFPASYESYQQLADMLRYVDVYNLGYAYFDEYAKKINAVSKEDIMKAARKYLHPDAFSIALVGAVNPKIDYLKQARELAAKQSKKPQNKGK